MPTNPQAATIPNKSGRNRLNRQTISASAFDKMSHTKKIEWLCRAAPPLPEDEDPGTELIRVGPRNMTRKDALCMALDFAVQSKRDIVPRICRQLTNEYRADDLTFSILGVPFPRARLTNWARDGLAPGLPTNVPPIMKNLGKELYINDSQNVHNNAVTQALKLQLNTIRDRVPIGERISQEAAEIEVRNYLNSLNKSREAIDGFEKVVTRAADLQSFNNISVRDSLGMLWNYIRRVPDDQKRQLLKDSMVAKLREISRERPCAQGMITRIIDTPTAIDWSLTPTLSHEHLREELRTLAGVVNEACNADRDLNAQRELMAGRAFGRGNATSDPDREIAKLIRERFMHTADIEFGLLRCIDRTLVSTEANHVFPEDAHL